MVSEWPTRVSNYKGSTPMITTSEFITSDTAPVESLVSIDKDGRIEVLDAAVLELIAGGVAAAEPSICDNNGNCPYCG